MPIETTGVIAATALDDAKTNLADAIAKGLTVTEVVASEPAAIAATTATAPSKNSNTVTISLSEPAFKYFSTCAADDDRSLSKFLQRKLHAAFDAETT